MNHLHCVYILVFYLNISGFLCECPANALLNPCKCENDRILCEGLNESDLDQWFQRLSSNLNENKKHFKTFELRKSTLTELKDKTFRDLTFDNIYISYNQNLRTIHRNAFNKTYLYTKTILIANNYALSSPDPTAIFNILSQFVSIEYIDLNYNNFTEIPSNAFKHLNDKNKLRFLQMSGDFKKLGEYAFENLNSLEHLGISGASISYIPENAFVFSRSSDTRLDIHLFNDWFINSTSFAANSLINIKRLTYLNLSVFKWPNQLTYLDETIFHRFLDAHYANTLDVSGQYMDCSDCRTSWVKKIEGNYNRIIKFTCSGGQANDDKNIFTNCPS